MDLVLRIVVYAAIGIVLLSANFWYISSVHRSLTGGDLVVAPIRIVNSPNAAEGSDEMLGRLVIERLERVGAELDVAQNQLLRIPADGGHVGVTVPGFYSKELISHSKAGLHTQLFEPQKMSATVAGVDVGGLLPSIQRWFVQGSILNFSVWFVDGKTNVSGDISALGASAPRTLYLQVDDAKMQSVADAIAYAVIQQKLAQDDERIRKLSFDEFKVLLVSIDQVAGINARQAGSPEETAEDYQKIYREIAPLAAKSKSWSELCYFTATLAESGGLVSKAIALYRSLLNSEDTTVPKGDLERKIASLSGTSSAIMTPAGADALQAITRHAAVAARELNTLLRMKQPAPPIVLHEDHFKNAYWDGHSVHAPPEVQNLPDVIYHEVALGALRRLWKFEYVGETGAIANSYADVLACVIRQRELKQKAEQADWVLSRGAIAWLTGKPSEITTDLRPLRSLKAPGTAYDDPLLGKDVTVANYAQRAPRTDPGGADIYINTGIGDKAFYEAAMKVGTDDAIAIWIEAMRRFTPTINYRDASNVIMQTAAALYGKNSNKAKAVQHAWATVGL